MRRILFGLSMCLLLTACTMGVAKRQELLPAAETPSVTISDPTARPTVAETPTATQSELSPLAESSAWQLKIDTPEDNAVLDVANPIRISGTGRGLFEGNLVVRVLDNEGNALLEEPTTMHAQEMGSPGTWQVMLSPAVEPGTRGVIYVFATSPMDGSIMVADAVNVVWGPPSPGPFVTISHPLPYSILSESTFTVTGRGGNLFESNVMVQALDSQGNVLIGGSTVVNSVEFGGEGDWQIELSVAVESGTPGKLVAFAASPRDGSIVASASMEVTFGGTP